jgi:PPOX class probable F420-dependent enzyme
MNASRARSIWNPAPGLPGRATYHRNVFELDQRTEFGARVATHLRDEIVVWFTSVTPGGAPVPNPVWFLWDGAATVTVYSMPGDRVRNIEAHPRVTLNFAGDGRGGDIVVVIGRAAVDPDAPPADANSAYLEKYAQDIARIGMTPESFAQRYSEHVRVELLRVRGH